MKKNNLIKILFTIVWTVIGLWLTIPVDDGRENGDYWMEGGDLVVKTSEPTFDLGFFAVFMAPVVFVWLWGLFKNDSKPKTQKRRSRMF